jgi:hypothetical protein
MLPRPVDVEREPFVTARYDVRGLVGSGGTATVHEVFDSIRGVSLAMKRLTPEAALKQTTCLLFRREYRTLRELSHPAIVRVFDYGMYDGSPYYTMELAPGTDVRALSPLPWQDACSLLRDVLSALSLLHSRRLVHRDVSAGNVRRTPDLRGKLLDFGSLCPMGVAPEVVGTPPFVPPESLDGRPLDARSDLYSVGALAYFLLTGTHAYPATRFSELKGAWSAAVAPPSSLAPDVPEALDALVLSLLNLNPLGRPVAAPEVFDRLSTIANLPRSESWDVALGYLATPTLVGRDEVISRFRRRLLSADRGRGSTLIIEGKPGFGRSRLLGSLVTEANLANVLTLCANGVDGQSRVFGVMRALAKRLLEADPVCARDSLPDAAVVDTLGLSGGSDSPPSGSTLGWRTRVDSVAAWFANIGARVPLVLAIDDIDDIDDASMAVIAKLSEAAPSRRLLIVATSRSVRGANGARFRRLGGSHTLRPLRSYETRALVASMFDDAAGVEMIATWIHELSEGCPRVAIELSQHLVDSGVARYESGSWALPVSLSGLNLPEDLGQAILLRVSELSPRARELAEGLSLCVEGEPLVLEEYPALLGLAEPEETFGALNELVAAHVLVGSGSAYSFVHDAMRAAVERSIPVEARGALHRRLAEIYRSGSNKASIVAAHHLLRAGNEASAFAILARFTAVRDEYAVRGYRFLRSPEGGRLHESLLDWGFANGAPLPDLLRIGMQLFGIASLAFGDVNRHAPLVMAELERETGLIYWDEFSHLEDPGERIHACVSRAAEHWAALPEDARGLSPQEAISVFSSCTTHLTGVFSRTHQIDGVAALLPNIDRLSPISPAVRVAADTVRFSVNARRGWLAGELRLSLLTRIKAPVSGLTETTRFGLRLLTMYYQGLEEAVLGNPLAFARADELEADAPYTALGWQLRTVAHLYQGQEKRAEACRRKRDVALAGQGEAERHVEAALSYESSACVVLGDLTAVKRVLPALRERAAATPGWLPHCIFVEGAHEALRGDLPKALELMYRAADLITPGEHHAWLQVENKLAHLLIELGREPEARERARRALETCRGGPLLPPYVDLLEATLALAEAKLGDSEAAKARVDECVRRSEARGATGILALDLYAAKAQVALAMRDAETFGAVSRRVAEMCANVDSKAFAARLSVLFRMSVGAGFEPVDVTAHPFRRRMTQTLARLRTELELCAGATERASRSLGMVLQQSGVQRGYLYLNQPEGFVLAASRSAERPPIGAEEGLLKWLRAFQSEAGEAETTSDGGAAFFGDRYRLVALVTDDGGSTVAPAVVIIDCEGAQPRIIPEYILRELANVLVDAGDVPRQ